jgi:hypothetical protein
VFESLFPSRQSSPRLEKSTILDVDELTGQPRLTSSDLFRPKSRNGLFCGNNPANLNDPMGLYADVSESGNNVNINIPIHYYAPIGGGTVSQATIDAFNNGIQSTWSGQIGRYNVTTTVVAGNENYVTVEGWENVGKTHVGGPDGYWGSAGDAAYTAAHEAGHLMGLDDQKDQNGNYLYNGDIMAGYGGSPSETDITAIIKYNTPPTTLIGKVLSAIARFFGGHYGGSPGSSSSFATTALNSVLARASYRDANGLIYDAAGNVIADASSLFVDSANVSGIAPAGVLSVPWPSAQKPSGIQP